MIEEKIKLRIKELEGFMNNSAAFIDKEPPLYGSDWYRIDDDIFEKYNIDVNLISDNYYVGECIDNMLFELRNLLKDNSKNKMFICDKCNHASTMSKMIIPNNTCMSNFACCPVCNNGSFDDGIVVIARNNYDKIICCERCSNNLTTDDEITLYNGELLCDDCLDEVKDENGYAHDLRW